MGNIDEVCLHWISWSIGNAVGISQVISFIEECSHAIVYLNMPCQCYKALVLRYRGLLLLGWVCDMAAESGKVAVIGVAI